MLKREKLMIFMDMMKTGMLEEQIIILGAIVHMNTLMLVALNLSLQLKNCLICSLVVVFLNTRLKLVIVVTNIIMKLRQYVIQCHVTEININRIILFIFRDNQVLHLDWFFCSLLFQCYHHSLRQIQCTAYHLVRKLFIQNFWNLLLQLKLFKNLQKISNRT